MSAAMQILSPKHFVLGLLALLAVVLAACTRGEWQTLEVSEGGFSVLMRPQPTFLKMPVDTPAGRTMAHLYSSDRPDAYFAVGYTDYPVAAVVGVPPDELFAGIRDTWIRRINGRLLMSGPVRLNRQYPGLEFTGEGRVKDADTFLHARVYLVDQRLYQVVAMGRKGEISQGVINRFLASFKLGTQGETQTLEVVAPPAVK
ncbi:MAG TPA: hypothetical protein VD867_18265 [Burkholderiales bacterium]|nr:hypothetical protein [Burkholderiales bacterium]